MSQLKVKNTLQSTLLCTGLLEPDIISFLAKDLVLLRVVLLSEFGEGDLHYQGFIITDILLFPELGRVKNYC